VELEQYLRDGRARVEAAIEAALPPRHPDAGRLVEAMRYTLLLPAKRMRGIVCLAVADALGGRERDVLPLAVAVEMVHAASLVLDDLPAFDDAHRRRGAATSHRVFGEATAVLAAVALLNAAFRHAALHSRPRWIGPDDAVGTVRELTAAVGEDGMVAGEALDLLAAGQTVGLDQLERIHALKTGSLFIACAVEAARLSGAGADEQATLRAYAKNVGLAFQITDDLLDAVGSAERTGKDVGRDREGSSFVAFAGIEGARQLADELIETAVGSLATLGRRGARLAALARYVGARDR
jgi:geranylgeranyl diphosphate synthase type II